MLMYFPFLAYVKVKIWGPYPTANVFIFTFTTIEAETLQSRGQRPQEVRNETSLVTVVLEYANFRMRETKLVTFLLILTSAGRLPIQVCHTVLMTG